MNTTNRVLGFVASIQLGLCAVTCTIQAGEKPVPIYTVNIPAGNLSDALQSLATSSNHKLLYSSKLIDGRKCTGLIGTFTVEKAVKQLLEGTNLHFEVTDDGLVTIQATPKSTPPNVDPSSAQSLRAASAPGFTKGN